MRRVLATEHGGGLYKRRQAMIEPVFAHTKFNRGINRFLQTRQIRGARRVAINHRDAQPPEAPQTPDRHQRGLTSPATALTADQAADDTARRIPPDGRRNPFARQPQPNPEAARSGRPETVVGITHASLVLAASDSDTRARAELGLGIAQFRHLLDQQQSARSRLRPAEPGLKMRSG